jgi:hypothetical protein
MLLCVAWPRARYPVASVMWARGETVKKRRWENEVLRALRAYRAQVSHDIDVKSHSSITTAIKQNSIR